ncbi:FkbM family methyltransferase [Synechococcus sp. CBW1006]|uniref:FkbM family methyltransferase n=1 Tax=Synechococcus sp. CBW1006 TaxID=1353138 RepID=UPI0018CF742D|nr:FkbM family methyltransferase [Synechococcus sp. CBW1006]QPN65929.1 FkbM family methyltransferase [Synechococcus sp. CBW1006]
MNSVKLALQRLLSFAGDERPLAFARFIRKLPALWREERCSLQHAKEPWEPNRLYIDGGDKFYPVFLPDDFSENHGSVLRTYNVFRNFANSWIARDEVSNFMRFARAARRFADVGSAEGFYSALFASMHGVDAEILSIDCGSWAGCNPYHSKVVREINYNAFRPCRWDTLQAFVTDNRRRPPEFSLPANTHISTLVDLLTDANFRPDLLKLDIESGEYEVIFDSLDFLRDARPTLIIEVHNPMLRERGLSFKPVLAELRRIGYSVAACDRNDYLTEHCHLILQCPI